MKIHAVASLPHYGEHVRSVWKHLPDGLKGRAEFGRNARVPKDADPRDLVLVGGFYDIERARGHRVAYVEHGAGQSYYHPSGKPHEAYHGAEHPSNVVGYICPRQEVADSWGRPAFAVGSPVCDPYQLFTTNERPVVAITFHWDCKLLPETRSALPHYQEDLGRLVRHLRLVGFEVLGHHHPRDARLPVIWRNLQVPEVDVATVRERADILVVDNSSLAYEMAHLGRAVVSLNAPWYRRDVSHGLRFWDAVPGLQVDHPIDLFSLDWEDLVYQTAINCTWAAVAAYGQPLSDGLAGVRAAAWLTARAGEL